MKICPVGVEFFCADGQTHIAKVIVAFRNFVNDIYQITALINMCELL